MNAAIFFLVCRGIGASGTRATAWCVATCLRPTHRTESVNQKAYVKLTGGEHESVEKIT